MKPQPLPLYHRIAINIIGAPLLFAINCLLLFVGFHVLSYLWKFTSYYGPIWL